MNSSKKSSIAVGVLFLIALVLNLIASGVFKPILNVPDYLSLVHPNKNHIVFANFLNIICAIAMIFIPIYLIPVVKTQFKNLLKSYIVFRSLEGILFIYLAIKSLSLIPLSKSFLSASEESVLIHKHIGNNILAEIEWATMVYILMFVFGGLSFYYLLFKSKLVPRILAVWGFVAILILFTGVLLAFFGVAIFENTELMEGMAYFAPPIALNELVLSIWLISRGYSKVSIKG